MEIQDIIFHLNVILNTNFDLSNEQKEALTQAITLIKKAKTKKQLLQALEILIKLLGIGSNFFEK